MTIRVTPLGDALGAQVDGLDLRSPLDAGAFGALMQAWSEHLVLRFRGQQLTDPELLAFSRRLGELDPPGPNPYGRPYLEGFPEINVISNVRDGGVPIGGLGDGEAQWHCDMTYVEVPPRAAALYALEVPASGGDTFWSNQYLAFETLPAELAQAIRGRSAVHDATYNSAGAMRRGMKEVDDPREAPGARHPLVIEHPETRRPASSSGGGATPTSWACRSPTARRSSTACGPTRPSRASPSARSGRRGTSCSGITAARCTGATRSTPRAAA